jgi:hypothetical protein
MPYRESVEKPKQDQISEFVVYKGPCPYCEGTYIEYISGNFDGGYRKLVRRRSWSFLWWKSHPAYYLVKCNQCSEYRKEFLPRPTDQTL